MLRYQFLLFKLKRLLGRGEIPAVEEVSLAGQLAEMLDGPDMTDRVIADLFDHEHPQIRHIAMRAVRRAHRYDAPALPMGLARRMLETDFPLRQDAVALVKDSGLDTGEIRTALRMVAGDVQLPQDAERSKQNPSDTVLALQVKARELLDVMIAKTAAEEVAALSQDNALGRVAGQAFASGSVAQNAIELEARRNEERNKR